MSDPRTPKRPSSEDRQRTLSSDGSQEASLSTTPTQSHIQSFSQAVTVKGAPPQTPSSGILKSTQREPSSFDGSQVGTIGRGQPPRPATTSGSVNKTPSVRPSLERQLSQSQRSVSYAPSDLETVSGMSASEYSSGGEDDLDQPAQGRGRGADPSFRQGVSTSSRPHLSNLSSSMTRLASGANTGKSTRRLSATGRDTSRAHRQSQVVRGGNFEDEEGKYGPLDEEDDEVQPHDRGEELVRRRMKARQKEKALRKRREREAERERFRQSQAFPTGPASITSPSSPHLKPGSGFSAGRPISPSPQLDGTGRPNTILLPPTSGFSNLQQGALSPTSQPAFPSPSGTRGPGANYPSPHGHIRRPSASQSGTRYSIMSYGQQSTVAPRTNNASTAESLQPQDPFADSLAAGSVAGRSSVDASSSVAGSVQGEGCYHDDDEERDTIASLAAGRGGRNDEQLEDEEEGLLDDEEEDSGSPDVEDGSDVEYTLKDRQDAINIEHPFGLPIWKPALYKKSRSVTRNAETALHLIPSAAAERHLLPGNILWTIFFGSWLMVICYLCAIVVNFVPLGGSKYARVIWELGGYLFWPFGKYVEVEVSPESGDRGKLAAEFCGAEEGNVYENSFTPVAARFPHDHTHHVPFNSRPASGGDFDTLKPSDARPAQAPEHQADGSSSGGSDAKRSTPRQSDTETGDLIRTSQQDETSSLKSKGKGTGSYGATDPALYENGAAPSEQERIHAESRIYGYVEDADGNEIGAADRLLGKVAFGIVYFLVLFPLMGLVCLACWGMVFTIPMAKLNWALIKNLLAKPLALHFRSAPGIERPTEDENEEGASNGKAKRLFLPLRPGQLAPRSKSFSQGTGTMHRRSKILLCTYRAVGSQYYKYTVGGVNILFVNLLPLTFFTIFDFFVIEKYVEHHHIEHGFLAFISGQGVIFLLALGSVIPLSYFIGMAVASISAQSSIGMGAVINATFGSIIEIILYAIALTQEKARLVEGSLIGSILAGVLLMPGLSMCSGATRRKEQRFNARSAGVTSTMLIMAIIGILTPTLFYQIYGTFQLTCEGCPGGATPGDTWTCKRCFYEHVPPATDPFFQENVRGLMYTCTVILVLSYGIGLWFSLRTHASQIWQNPLPAQQPLQNQVSTAPHVATLPSAQRASIYKRLVPAAVMQQLLPTAQRPQSQNGGSSQGTIRQHHGKHGTETSVRGASETNEPPPLHLSEQFSQEDYERAVALTASAFHNAFQQGREHHAAATAAAGNSVRQSYSQGDQRHVSMHEGGGEDDGGHGGHDAPSWSRGTSVSVLLGCTVLYAIIAEILVDVVDVVLDGSGIDEKFLGITLFALVPNTTEFMNAMSFAINGNIALSMEIGSAYALQVCLIQIPAMVAFSAYYNGSADVPDNLIHRSFTLIFPRWDVIAIIFSVFLLTYTYIEARSNYYRGSICILSYTVLVAGFFFAPNTGDTEMPGDDSKGPTMGGFSTFSTIQGRFGAYPIGVPSNELLEIQNAPALRHYQWMQAMLTSLWSR